MCYLYNGEQTINMLISINKSNILCAIWQIWCEFVRLFILTNIHTKSSHIVIKISIKIHTETHTHFSINWIQLTKRTLEFPKKYDSTDCTYYGWTRAWIHFVISFGNGDTFKMLSVSFLRSIVWLGNVKYVCLISDLIDDKQWKLSGCWI